MRRLIVQTLLWIVSSLVIAWISEPGIESIIGRDVPFQHLWTLTLGLLLLYATGRMMAYHEREEA